MEDQTRTTVVAVVVVIAATIAGALDKLSSDALQGIYYVVIGGAAGTVLGRVTQSRRDRKS